MEILAQVVVTFFYGVTAAFAFSMSMAVYHIVREKKVASLK